MIGRHFSQLCAEKKAPKQQKNPKSPTNQPNKIYLNEWSILGNCLLNPWPLPSKERKLTKKTKPQLCTWLLAAGAQLLLDSGVSVSSGARSGVLPWQQAQLQLVRTQASAKGVMRDYHSML